MLLRLLKWFVSSVVLVFVIGLGWLYFAPPDLIRVGANYGAKTVCSNVFIAGRDAGTVMRNDVQAPGHPLLRFLQFRIDEELGLVEAGLLGMFGKGWALHDPGSGCYSLPNGFAPAERWGPGSASGHADNRLDEAHNAVLQNIVERPDLQGRGARAIVVLHQGQLKAETYPEPGIDAETPLLGWSMAKTVTAAIIGRLIAQGRLSLDEKALFAEWNEDARKDISVADLLGMASGLEWNEGYGSVSDVTAMLYLHSDTVMLPQKKPLQDPPGTRFVYSSGNSVLLSRLWQDRLENQTEARSYPHDNLFAPLGMTSAVFEADASGTFSGSSYLYATARDWARFGQFLLQEGRVRNRALLLEGYVDWMRQPHPSSNKEYGRGSVWLRSPTAKPGDPDPGLPADTFWMAGHDGQSVAIIPSLGLVIVRLGLTPSNSGYNAAHLVAAVIEGLKGQ